MLFFVSYYFSKINEQIYWLTETLRRLTELLTELDLENLLGLLLVTWFWLKSLLFLSSLSRTLLRTIFGYNSQIFSQSCGNWREWWNLAINFKRSLSYEMCTFDFNLVEFSSEESSFVSACEKWLRRDRVNPFVGAVVDFVDSVLLWSTSGNLEWDISEIVSRALTEPCRVEVEEDPF